VMFIDIQDDNLPKLIVCQSMTITAGLTFGQFSHFMKQSEEQISMVILEAFANNLLMIGEEEEHVPVTSVHSVLH